MMGIFVVYLIRCNKAVQDLSVPSYNLFFFLFFDRTLHLKDMPQEKATHLMLIKNRLLN